MEYPFFGVEVPAGRDNAEEAHSPYVIRIASALIRRISHPSVEQQNNAVIATEWRMTESQWRVRIIVFTTMSILSLVGIIVPFSLTYLLNLGAKDCAQRNGQFLFDACDSISCADVFSGAHKTMDNFLQDIDAGGTNPDMTKSDLLSVCAQHTCSFFAGLPSINKNYDPVPGLPGLFMQCVFPWTAVFPLSGILLLTASAYHFYKSYSKRPIVSDQILGREVASGSVLFGQGEYLPPDISEIHSINNN